MSNIELNDLKFSRLRNYPWTTQKSKSLIDLAMIEEKKRQNDEGSNWHPFHSPLRC